MLLNANTSTQKALPISFNSCYQFATGEGFFNKNGVGCDVKGLSNIGFYNPNNVQLTLYVIAIGT